MPRKLRLPRLLDRKRLAIGFFAAALLPGFLIGAGWWLSSAATVGFFDGLYSTVQVTVVTLYFTVPAILAFGLPIFIVYRRLAWEPWWGYVLAGAASAVLWMIAYAALKLGTFPEMDAKDLRMLLVKIAIPGAVAGLVFYLTVYVKYHHIAWSFTTRDKKWLWLLLIPALLVQERLLDWANDKIDENSSSFVKVMLSAWDWLAKDLF